MRWFTCHPGTVPGGDLLEPRRGRRAGVFKGSCAYGFNSRPGTPHALSAFPSNPKHWRGTRIPRQNSLRSSAFKSCPADNFEVLPCLKGHADFRKRECRNAAHDVGKSALIGADCCDCVFPRLPPNLDGVSDTKVFCSYLHFPTSSVRPHAVREASPEGDRSRPGVYGCFAPALPGLVPAVPKGSIVKEPNF